MRIYFHNLKVNFYSINVYQLPSVGYLILCFYLVGNYCLPSLNKIEYYLKVVFI